ncbi:hypothetical protein Anas_10252 [Armadillidium nasatum]|uniref:Uncharacterized protein n=1 Tax=Armadillidium nasatum TaxID=96803 RepID=A0A5N5SYL9_9CRUS|nr:hypothetical protein Anas_10252 [Armadillidium nasatum]
MKTLDQERTIPLKNLTKFLHLRGRKRVHKLF